MSTIACRIFHRWHGQGEYCIESPRTGAVLAFARHETPHCVGRIIHAIEIGKRQMDFTTDELREAVERRAVLDAKLATACYMPAMRFGKLSTRR